MGQHEATVRQAARRFRRAESAIARARSDLVDAVLAALRDRERPTDVADWSPFSATYLRKLARKHGIPPARKGSAAPPD